MASSGAVQPVRRFRFSTRDEAETEDFIRRMYVGIRLRFNAPADGARFSATVADTGSIIADHIRSTVDYSAVTDPFGYYLFLAIYNGRFHVRQGRDETITLAGEPTYFPLGATLDMDVIDLGARILRLPAVRLEEAAAEIAGIGPADLRFESAKPVSVTMARHWSALIDLTSSALLAEDSALACPLLAAEMAHTAALTALHTFPNTAMTCSPAPSPGQVAPAALRRAVAYIEENAQRPVALSDIAAAAGTGARALQYAFTRYYGTTPTGYLRRVRLEHAHRELQAADPTGGDTVSAIAARWGFAKSSRFAAAYRKAYGRPPGHTLRT